MTPNNTIFLFEIYQFLNLHLQSSSASRNWKNANVIRFADLVHRVRRDPSVTLRKFSPDTTGHGLQITKRPAVWYFSIFLFEKYQFLLEIFYLHLESSSASRKSEKFERCHFRRLWEFRVTGNWVAARTASRLIL